MEGPLWHGLQRGHSVSTPSKVEGQPDDHPRVPISVLGQMVPHGEALQLPFGRAIENGSPKQKHFRAGEIVEGHPLQQRPEPISRFVAAEIRCHQLQMDAEVEKVKFHDLRTDAVIFAGKAQQAAQAKADENLAFAEQALERSKNDWMQTQ